MDTRLLERRMRALERGVQKILEARKAGQNPSSPEWFFGKACLLDQLDASMFMAKFHRLVVLGVSYPEALVTSYKQYRVMREEPDASALPQDGVEGKAKIRLTFDRAFDLACHTYAIWRTAKPSLMLADCPKCHSRYLTALSLRPDPNGCFFCKLLERYRTNERIRKSFQNCSRSPVNEALASHLASLISLSP